LNKILLFGGSFNPVHHGHLIVSRHVAEQLGLARVVLMPSANPPHKPPHGLAPPADRLEMCRLAVAGDASFEVSEWEIQRSGPNYTFETVRHYREAAGGDVELYWLIGMDSLHELGTWYRARDLVETCTIVTAARPGFSEPDAAGLAEHFSAAAVERLLRHVVAGPWIDIAGTDIRARAEAGRSIRYLVPDAVREHIERCGLYRG